MSKKPKGDDGSVRHDGLSLDLGNTRVFANILSGKMAPGQRFSLRDAQGFAKNIESILGSQPSDEPISEEVSDQSLIDSRSGIKIVQMKAPHDNTVYVTYAINGKVVSSCNFDDGFKVQNLRDQGLFGYDSINSLFRESFGNIALPIPERPKSKKGKSKGPRRQKEKDGEPKGPKSTPPPKKKYMVDPVLHEYLKEHRQYLTSHAFKRGGKKPSIVDHEGLVENLDEAVVDKANELQYGISVDDPINFIRRHRQAVLGARAKRLADLLDDERVSNGFWSYMSVIGHPGDSINQDSCLETRIELGEGTSEQRYIHMPTALDFLCSSTNSRNCYEYFTDTQNAIEGVEPEEMMEALLTHVRKATKSSPEEMIKKLDSSLLEWVRLAKAAKFVAEEDRISTEVVPLFDEAARSHDRQSDRVYNGVRLLVGLMVGEGSTYSPNELKFITRGLWLHGYFQKDVRGANGPNGGDGNETDMSAVDRELNGVDREFTSPATHLIKRYAPYEGVLMPVFDRLLSEDKISKDLKLQTKIDDATLGILLYENVEEDVRNRTFTQLIAGNPPLSTPVVGANHGGTTGGTQCRSILEYFIGVNRDELLGKVKKHYSRGG